MFPNAAPSTTQSFGLPFSGANTTTTPSLSTALFPSTSVPGLSQVGFGNLPTTSAPNLFGGTTFGVTTTTSSLFPALGQTTTSTLGGGLGVPSQVPGSTFSFGSVTPATTAQVTKGLGGVDFQPSTGIDAATGIIKNDKAVVETQLPPELATLVDSFKKYLKDQKSKKEEIARVTSKDIEKVCKQASSLRRQLLVTTSSLSKHKSSIQRLRNESIEELKNVEIIRKTRDIPPSLQYENILPSQYFHNLLIRFENQMQSYRQQIEPLEKYLMSLSQPAPITHEELNQVVRHIHDAFVTLAAQLEPIHKKVQLHKEQFLAIRKATGSDVYDVFDAKRSTLSDLRKTYRQLPIIARNKDSILPVTTFNTSGNFTDNKPQGIGMQNQSTVPSFGSPSLGFSGDSSLNNSQRPFQLLKPPSGNKRGKRWTTN